MAPCSYGIDMSTVGELFAPRFLGDSRSPDLNPEELRKLSDELGTNSLRYLTVDALTRGIGATENELCLGCLVGSYPTPWGNALYREALRCRDQADGPRTYERAGVPSAPQY
jgi:amidophosphoribosyltransferase